MVQRGNALQQLPQSSDCIVQHTDAWSAHALLNNNPSLNYEYKTTTVTRSFDVFLSASE